MKEGRHFGRFAVLLLYAYLSLMRRLRGPQKALIWGPFWILLRSQNVLKMVWKIDAKKSDQNKAQNCDRLTQGQVKSRGFLPSIYEPI